MSELFKDIGVCKNQEHQLINGGQELEVFLNVKFKEIFFRGN